MWSTPKHVKDVRAFIGLCSYCRRFVYIFSEVAKPLHILTEKKTTTAIRVDRRMFKVISSVKGEIS